MSPTLQTLVMGFIILVVMALAGRFLSGNSGLSKALKLFFPIWLIYCIWHMYVGVIGHSYPIMEELPILLLNFGIPSLVALLILCTVK